MIITKKIKEDTLFFAPTGRLDTMTAAEFEQELVASLDAAKKLVLDLSDVAYISSAGLRVLLKVQKLMASKDGMKVTGANTMVMEVFVITGFADILTIE